MRSLPEMQFPRLVGLDFELCLAAFRQTLLFCILLLSLFFEFIYTANFDSVATTIFVQCTSVRMHFLCVIFLNFIFDSTNRLRFNGYVLPLRFFRYISEDEGCSVSDFVTGCTRFFFVVRFMGILLLNFD